GDRRARNRIAVAPRVLRGGTTSDDGLAGDDELVALGGAVAAGAGMVVTQLLGVSTTSSPRINTDEQAVAWRRVVDYIHAKGGLIAARIGTAGAVVGAVEEAV